MSSIRVPFNGTMTYDDIKKYLPASCSVNDNSISYRGHTFKLIFNHGTVKANKFQSAFKFTETNTKTIIPGGVLTIDFKDLDRQIDHIEKHCKKAENERRASAFKLQLFEPYIADTLISSLPESIRESSKVVKEVSTDGLISFKLHTPLMNISFALKEKTETILEKEYDEYFLALGIQFQNVPMAAKLFTLSQWKKLLPDLFAQFEIIVTDLKNKNDIRTELITTQNQNIQRLKSIYESEVELTKRATNTEIANRCKSEYTLEYMTALIKDLKCAE